MTDDKQLYELADLDDDARRLIRAAMEARHNAYAPYSDFAVGAALRDGGGEIHSGCNVEISSYGLTLCAERVALFAAWASGVRHCTALAVVGPGSGGAPTPPCGACRQVIWDLAEGATVYLATLDGRAQIWTASELLPGPFGPADLGSHGGGSDA